MAKKHTVKRTLKKRNAQAQANQNSEPVLSRKEQKALERQATKARNQLIQFTIIAFVGCGFIGLITGLLVEPKLGIAVGGALLCLTLSFKYQRQALYAFLIYVPFSGTITYALGGSALLQLAKDAFYIPALIGVIQYCRARRLPIILPKSLAVPLGIAVTVVTMTLFLVNLPQQLQASGNENPLFMGLLGFKVLFSYIPIITCIYYLIRTKEDLYFLLRIQVVLVLVACGLGLVQYLMLKTGHCAGTQGTGSDLFKASLEARCFVGGSLLYAPSQGQIRLPGTFVAPWQWGWFLISSAFFSFGTAFNDRSPFWRLMGILSLIAVLTLSVLSGQRIALFLVPTVIVGLCLLTGQMTNLTNLFKRFLPIGIVVGLILAVLVVNNPALIQDRIDSFRARWEASPPHAFIIQQFQESMASQSGLFGNGVGRATNSARMFGRVRLIETYHPKLLYELGPLGLLSILALYTTLTVATFKAYRQTKDKNLRGYAASMWVFVLFISYFPYYYPLDVDPVSVYYWLAAGIALKIPKLDKQERDLAKREAAKRSGKKLRNQKNREPEFV